MLPQRRLKFVNGGISAHCSVLNDEKCMQLIDLSNKVAAVMANIYNNKEAEKVKSQQKKQQEDVEKDQRWIVRLEKEKEAEKKGKEVCEKVIKELDEKGSDIIRTFTVLVLKDLLRYHFWSDVYKRSGVKKAELTLVLFSAF